MIEGRPKHGEVAQVRFAQEGQVQSASTARDAFINTKHALKACWVVSRFLVSLCFVRHFPSNPNPSEQFPWPVSSSCIPFSIPQASILIYIFRDGRQTALPNVIIFGETGAGKSSVVNMLSGGETAEVNSDAKGVTFQHERYVKDIGGRRLNVFDTVGLNEADGGTVSSAQAIGRLYWLMHGLKDGVSLLVYVVRGPRLKTSVLHNYKLFYEIFCDKEVPIVLVITALENEEDMDGWWKKNEATYLAQKMTFSGAACITAIKGKRDHFKEEFEQSREKVEKLILKHCAKTPWLPPAGGVLAWLNKVLTTAYNLFAHVFKMQVAVFSETIYQALMSCAGLHDKEAREWANKIYKGNTSI